MIEDVKKALEYVLTFSSEDKKEVEAFKVQYLGKRGVLNSFFGKLKSVGVSQKKVVGQELNILKSAINEKVKNLKTTLETKEDSTTQVVDITKISEQVQLGARHPISLIRNEVVDIFKTIGFVVSQGPEIEDDWHNFTALNLPKHHPARDMQDTFFIQTDPDILLRTHTSSVQVRYMEENSPPIRTISPGRVFRNEDISARSHCLFHQVEGLYIDENVSFADLKQVLLYFSKQMFGKSKIRLRPSYFPFTEPSAEVDIYWGLNNEIDYKITKGTGWLEILGCGMVDVNVLKNCNIDHNKYSGFAFGMGLERMAMLKYGIEDIRMFYENDIRFLKQFTSAI